MTSAGQQLVLPKPVGYIGQNYNHLAGYTSSRVGLNTTTAASQNTTLSNGQTIASMVHQKLQQSSKTNLHKHVVVEDKENRRDMVNRQSTNMPSLGAS